MRYAAWDARLSKPDEQGVPARDHLIAAARRGSAHASTELEGPPFPSTLDYLWGWFRELRQGLGRDMAGPSPLTWVTLDAWSRLTGHQPEPHEVEALFTLDLVTRFPASVEA